MHPIHVASRRRKRETLLELYPGAQLLDVTSRGPEPLVRFSPFFPHGDLPVPGWPEHRSASVEGIWQGLKVFERDGEIDPARFAITSMRGIKRTVRKYGPVAGHSTGPGSAPLLGLAEARRRIFIPSYLFVLEERLPEEVEALRAQARQEPLVLLDYATNGDVEAPGPLSHASVLARFLQSGRADGLRGLGA